MGLKTFGPTIVVASVRNVGYVSHPGSYRLATTPHHVSTARPVSDVYGVNLVFGHLLPRRNRKGKAFTQHNHTFAGTS